MAQPKEPIKWEEMTEEQKFKKGLKVSGIIAGCVLGVILALSIIFGSYFLVQVGEVGVVFNKMSGKTTVSNQGLHFKVPFFENVTKFDVQTQSINLNEEGSSKDLQIVKINTVCNLHLQVERVNDVYMKIGPNWIGKVVNPITIEVVKSLSAGYNVEEIIVKRDTLRQQIEKELRSRLLEYNIILETVNLVNIGLTKEYNNVVEQKQIEQQNILVKENIRKQAEISKATKILDAEGEARKNQLMQSSATEQIIALEWIKKWKGDLPTTMLGDGKNIMISIEHEKK